MYSEILDKKCIVRSYDAGVYYGTVTAVDGETVKVENVRNIWYWEGANCLSDVATNGITSGKVSRVVSSMVLNRYCQIIPCEDAAIKNLDRISVWSY